MQFVKLIISFAEVSIMALKDILRPSVAKVAADSTFVVAFLAILLLVPAFGFSNSFAALDAASKTVSVAGNAALGLIMYYPLACGAVSLCMVAKGRGRKSRGKDAVWSLVLIAIFNPVTLGLVYSTALYTNNQVLSEPCGMWVTGFYVESPAERVGMSVGETIVSIDGTEIGDAGSLLHALASKRAGDTIGVVTDRTTYDIVAAGAPESPQSAFLGVKLDQRYCRK